MEFNKVGRKKKLGDFYRITLTNGASRFFQYIANDSSQLGSDVIIVYKGSWPAEIEPRIEDVVASGRDFATHVLVKAGEKLGVWRFYSNAPIFEQSKIYFRDTLDYGRRIAASEQWIVWSVGEERVNQHASKSLLDLDVGVIASPKSLLRRLEGGVLFENYPDIKC